MTPCPNPTQLRCATVLAAGTSACCTILMLLALARAWPDGRPDAPSVETMLWWVTTVLLAQLAWSCGRAAASCRRETRVCATLASAGTSGEQDGHRSLRAARRFVAIAGLLTATAPPALAATSAVPSSTPTPTFAPLEHESRGPWCDTSPEPEWTSVDPSVARACTRITPASSDSAARTHVVRPGETLWGIATSAPGVGHAAPARAVEAWIRANPALASHPDLVHAGDRLVVPGSPGDAPTGRA